MYYFIAAVFFYGFPVLLLLSWKQFFGSKIIWNRILYVLQIAMVFHSIFFVRQLIGLYQLAKTMGLKSSVYMPPWLEIFQMSVLIIWPFCLWYKKLASKIWAGIPIWIVLLSLPRFVSFDTDPLALLINSLFYISLFTGIYGLAWLLKRFPDQHKV